MRRIIISNIFSAFMCISVAAAAVPGMISYQGRLTTPQGVPVTNGNYLIKFAIFGASSGGLALWSCDYQTVAVTDGLFDVKLGAAPMPPFPHDLFATDSTRYLEIKVGTDPEFAPRTALASVAYSFQALRADSSQNAKIADMATMSEHATTADTAYYSISAAHATTADTAEVLKTPWYYRLLGADFVGGTVDSGGFAQIGNTIAVGAGEVQHYVNVVFDFQHFTQTIQNFCSPEFYYEVRIGQTGFESVKDSTQLRYFSIGTASGGLGGATGFQFYYEPTALEKTNGFNVQIFVKLNEFNPACSVAYIKLRRCLVFGI